MSAADHAWALLAAARRQERALAEGDLGALEVATRDRDAAFDALRRAVDGTPPEGVREALAALREVDARLAAWAPRVQAELRRQQSLVGLAREAAGAVRPKDRPRFVEVRV